MDDTYIAGEVADDVIHPDTYVSRNSWLFLSEHEEKSKKPSFFQVL